VPPEQRHLSKRRSRSADIGGVDVHRSNDSVSDGGSDAGSTPSSPGRDRAQSIAYPSYITAAPGIILDEEGHIDSATVDAFLECFGNSCASNSYAVEEGMCKK
jgi:hypothetical protein